MSGNELSEKQKRLWLLAAISAPLAQLTGGTSWLAVLLTGVLCGAFLYFVQRLRDHIDSFPSWFAAAVQIWVLVKLLFLIKVAGNCWQADQSGYFVPVVLLLLAALSAQKGLKAAAGAACIVFCFIVVGYGTTIAASLQSMRIKWLMCGTKEIQPQLVAVFLIPVVTLLLPQRNRTLNPTILGIIAALGGLLALSVNGVLSPGLAGNYENRFFEMSRSISIAGMIERIEAVTAAVMVLGWFALFSIYFGALSEMWSTVTEFKMIPVWMTAGVVAALYVLGLNVNTGVALGADAALCVLILVQAEIARWKKKQKKIKKGG